MTTMAKGVASVPGGGRLSWGQAWRYARLGGSEESLRRALIVLCSAVATVPLYFAAWLPATRESSWSSALAFTGDPGLWPGILTALLVMTLPAIHLAMIASRVGGPARDRRLAGMRSAGATMADVRRVLRVEALTCALLGAVLGALLGTVLLRLGSHVVLLRMAADVNDPAMAGREWQVPLLTPVWPHPALVLLAVVVVPCLAAALAPLAVRRVTVGIHGQASEERRVRAWLPGALLVAALACAALVWVVTEIPTTSPAGYQRADRAVFVLSVLGIVLLLLALTVAAPVAAARLGALLGRGDGPVRLLVGRSMVARPALAARPSASLVLVGLAAGLLTAGAGVLGSEIQRHAVENGYSMRVDGAYTQDGLFYLAPVWVAQGVAVVAALLGLVGIVIAVAEHAVTHRSRLARLVAGGVPRGTVARAMVLEAGLPAAVMGPLSLLCGLAVPVGAVLIAGRPELVDVSWGYVVPLLALLALAPFAAAWLGSRWVARTDDLGDLRDR